MTMHLEIELGPTDDGVRLTQRLELRPRWWLWPMATVLWPLLMRGRVQEAMDRTVANAKRMAEDRARA